jgi:glycosyltransferase involved in cell wall biosynthesis
MEKIKVLHIQETIASGGVERTRLSLSKLIDKDIFELKIICTNATDEMLDQFKKQNVEVIPIGILKSPLQWSQHRKVQKIIDFYKPHIIHGAVFEGVTMAAVNGFIKKVPIIIIEETSDPQNRSWRGNLLMKLFSKVSDVVVGVSPGVVEYLENTLKIPKNKIRLINNGVAIPRNIAEQEIIEAKHTFGISSEDFVIGSVGRMLQDEHKRFSDLIKAFAQFAIAKENCKLLLVGDGNEKIKYSELAIALGIENKVIFTGYQQDVSLYYKMMDVFALVSAYEAFGLVLAEAMLNKLPVVATKVGGMKYIVEDNESGFLVEKFNVNEIDLVMNSLYQDKVLRKKMGENGYKKAIEEYTEHKYVHEIEKLYNSFIK